MLKYLVCQKATNGHGCKASKGDKGRTYYRLHDFEKSALSFIKELNLGGLDDHGIKERVEITNTLQAAEGRVEDLRRQREGYVELFLELRTDHYKDLLKDIETKITVAEKEVKTLTEASRNLSHEVEARSKSRAEIHSLIKQISVGGEENAAIRMVLRTRLRDLIERIVIHHDPSSHDKGLLDPAGFTGKSFSVYFRDGTRRIVFPSAEDPTKLQVMGWLPDAAEVEKIKKTPIVEWTTPPWGKWTDKES